MPLTIANAESAYLTATARHKRWLTGFMGRWQAPLTDAIMVTWWETIPPEVKAAAKAKNPAGYAAIEKKIAGLKQER